MGIQLLRDQDLLSCKNKVININAINYPKGLLYTTPEVSGQCKSTISPSKMNRRPGTSAIDASAMTSLLRRCVNKKRRGFYYGYPPKNHYGARTCTYARVVVLRMHRIHVSLCHPLQNGE